MRIIAQQRADSKPFSGELAIFTLRLRAYAQTTRQGIHSQLWGVHPDHYHYQFLLIPLMYTSEGSLSARVPRLPVRVFCTVQDVRLSGLPSSLCPTTSWLCPSEYLSCSSRHSGRQVSQGSHSVCVCMCVCIL